MTLAAGARLGPYEIVALAGAGGMGEVYRARDTRLDRTVAIKILPRHLHTEDRRVRFEHEARALSRLSHPRICALFDIGHDSLAASDEPGGGDRVDFLVMEYLEGDTLAQRLAVRPLRLDAAIRRAVEIAEALDGAHRQGFTHRDLKPGNIMLTATGIKLMDFGLAKWEERDRAADDFTRTGQLDELIGTRGPGTTLTDDGTIVGTIQYMAPEQLQGRPIDGRVDIFAFGAVLYEMIAGQKAFTGATAAEIATSILERDPPPLPATTADSAVTSALQRTVTKCLAKDPEDRWQTARDLASELRWIGDRLTQTGSRAAGAGPTDRRRLRRWMRSAAVIGSLGAGITIGWFARRQPLPESPPPLTVMIAPPEGSTFDNSGAFMALSPDGRYLAFVATTSSGDSLLWIRPLGGPAPPPVPLPGTNGASQPFWSPDSRFVAFVTGASLKKVDVIARALPTRICDVQAGTTGGTWNRDDTILIPRFRSEGIDRVSANGGTPVLVTKVDDSKDIAHQWPSFLPDGHHFIFSIKADAPERTGLYAGSLDGAPPKRLTNAFSSATYAHGFLLFGGQGTLFAQSFDPASLTVSGTPIPIAGGISQNPATGRITFSVSDTGLLAYRPALETQLVWFDRGGRRLEPPLTLPGHYENPTVSPNGDQVAVQLLDSNGTPDILLIDVATAKATRLTEDPSWDGEPVWAPNSAEIAFASDREGRWRIFRKPIAGSSSATPLVTSIDGIPDDWSTDGRVVVEPRGAGGRFGLWIVTPGAAEPSPLVRNQSATFASRLAPNGQWIAYVTRNAEHENVFVQSIEQPETRGQVSASGGTEPQWSADGKELFYLNDDRQLFAVAVRTDPFEVTGSTKLFSTQVPKAALTLGRHRYTPSPDGRRFLMNIPAGRDSGLTVVANWTAMLKR